MTTNPPSGSPNGHTAELSVEQRTIYYIPLSERHGRARILFPVWLAPNLGLVGITTGVLVAVLGLNLLWALIIIVLGNAIGAIFAAFHSAQGPRMGIPQMVQSRAQFGVLGGILPMIIAVVVLLGFFAVVGVLVGQTFADLFHVSVTVGIILGSLVALVIALVGYDLVHRYSEWIIWPTAIVLLIASIKAISHPIPAVAHPAIGVGNLLLVLSIVITYQITWAPYVADYSRYLPEKDASKKATFIYTYLGLVVGATWTMSIGAIVAIQSQAAATNPAFFISHLLGSGWAWIMLVGFLLCNLQGNILGLYSVSMSMLAMADPFVNLAAKHRDLTIRWAVAVVACVAATIVAIIGQHGFITKFENFLVFILYFLIPWTSINLVDFYLVRRGRYLIDDLYRREGRYGATNWRAVGIYVVTILIELPFVNSTYFVGPVAKSLGGADISWVIGLAISGGAYYLVARSKGWTDDAQLSFKLPAAEDVLLESASPLPPETGIGVRMSTEHGRPERT